MNSLVTIGMPIYNRPIEMRKAIESVLAQTYTNIEIIISNDNSPNPEIDRIVNEYTEKDSRIIYYRHDKSIKTVSNYSFVKDLAKGKYFMWLADDDWLDEYFIEKCLSFLESHSDFTVCTGKCIYQDNGKEIHADSSVSLLNNSPFNRIIKFYSSVSLNGYFYGLIRKSALLPIEFYDEMGFDWEVVSALLFQGKIRVLDSTSHYISKGGVSNESNSMSKHFKKNNYISRNFIGLAISLNCSAYIFKSKIFALNGLLKIIYLITVFLITYVNIINWDLLFIKRKLLSAIGIKNGVLFKRN